MNSPTYIYSNNTRNTNLLILLLVLIVIIFFLIYLTALATYPSKLNCSAYSIPSPTNLSIINTSDTTIQLSWTPVSSADGYKVYESQTSGANIRQFDQIQNVYTTTSPSLTLTLIPDITYYFQITSFKNIDNTTTCSSDPSPEYKYTLPFPTQPFIMTTTNSLPGNTSFLQTNKLMFNTDPTEKYAAKSLWTMVSGEYLYNKSANQYLTAMDTNVILTSTPTTKYTYINNNWCLKSNPNLCLNNTNPITIGNNNNKFINIFRPIDPYNTQFYIKLFPLYGNPLYLYYKDNLQTNTQITDQANYLFIFNEKYQISPITNTSLCLNANAINQPLTMMETSLSTDTDSIWNYDANKQILCLQSSNNLCFGYDQQVIISTNPTTIKLVL